MQSYEGSMSGADNVRKAGATQAGGSGSDGPSLPGGSGSTKVVGSSTPTVVKTGAENNG